MTLDDLAVMVAEGFDDVKGQMATKQDLAEVKQDLSEVKQEIINLKHEVGAVKSNVNNYLELSEKRYSELKQRDALLAKWLKLVADKTGVPIDVSSLEKI